MLSSSVIFVSTSLLLYPSDSVPNVSVVDGVEEEFPIKLKKSDFEDDDSVDCTGVVDLDVAPSSTNPLESVGITIFFLGIRTTPRLWSSRMSIILCLFLKIIILISGWFI